MRDIDLNPWVSLACFTVITIYILIAMRRSRKEHPEDKIRLDLWNIYFLLALMITLSLIDKVHVFLCFH